MMKKTTPEVDDSAVTQQVNPMDKFRIRDKANTPQRIMLIDPATGKDTEDYLEVVSSLSDRFRQARDKAMRDAAVIASIAHDESREQAAGDARLEMYAALVTGWSFPSSCTPPNVVEFLRDAPQLQNLVVAVADDGERFFNNA